MKFGARFATRLGTGLARWGVRVRLQLKSTLVDRIIRDRSLIPPDHGVITKSNTRRPVSLFSDRARWIINPLTIEGQSKLKLVSINRIGDSGSVCQYSEDVLGIDT